MAGLDRVPPAGLTLVDAASLMMGSTSNPLQQIEEDQSLACAEVQYLVDFIRTSQRGVILRRASRRAEEVLTDE